MKSYWVWGFLILLLGRVGAQDIRFLDRYDEGATPRLGQAARLSGLGQEFQNYEIKSLGPAPGYFTFGYLVSQWNLPGDLTLGGPGLVYLPHRGLTSGEREFTAELIKFLRDQRVNPQVSFVLENLDLPSQIPAGPEFKIAGGIPGPQGYQGRISIAFRSIGGPWKPGQTVTCFLRPFLMLPKARVDIPFGQTCEGAWDWAPGDLTKIPGRHLDTPEDSWVAAKYIRAGEFFKEGSVKVQLPVVRGQEMTLQVTKGALAVEIRAQAMEEGRIGQVIKFRTAGGKIFSAEVLDKFLARVEMPGGQM